MVTVHIPKHVIPCYFGWSVQDVYMLALAFCNYIMQQDVRHLRFLCSDTPQLRQGSQCLPKLPLPVEPSYTLQAYNDNQRQKTP